MIASLTFTLGGLTEARNSLHLIVFIERVTPMGTMSRAMYDHGQDAVRSPVVGKTIKWPLLDNQKS